METYIYWFVLALILLGLEMASGTFYLLVVAIAAGAAGFASLLGVSLPWQLVLCAVMVVAGTIVLRRWRGTPAKDSVNASFDLGQAVKVVQWHDDGSARVMYRGAEWDAETESTDTPRDATLYIGAVQGTRLVLTHHKPQ